MRILLCADPLAPSVPDEAFADDVGAIVAAEIEVSLLDIEALLAGSTNRAVRRLPTTDLGLVVYRGWMLPGDRYEALDGAIRDRGGALINDPGAYRRTHELPGWYDALADRTPRSIWLSGTPPFDPGAIQTAVAPFGDAPILVKDFVKSRKHEWATACFIPHASDSAALDRVVGTFIERQADEFAGGLVFREFVELEEVGRHGVSGLRLSREYRLFFLDGQLLAADRYWEEVDYADDSPAEPFIELAARIDSRFFAMDIARTSSGDWIVIELGDAQVSAVPTSIDLQAFYADLADRVGP